MIKFDVKNWFTGDVQFTAEIDCKKSEETSIKLGLAVKWAAANGASLVRARLDGARLDGASLDGARLDGASLVRARLDGARLDGARLDGATGLHFNVPQEGSLTVWKKLQNGCIAKLLIPADAGRTATPIGRKCRAERVEVLAIFDSSGSAIEKGNSQHDGTEYEVGKTVTPDRYDNDFRVECSNGIHFFQTREEAEAY